MLTGLSVELSIQNLLNYASFKSENGPKCSESQNHRILISLLFKLSNAKQSHEALLSCNELASWLLCYLNRIHLLYLRLKLDQLPCHKVQEVFAAINLSLENSLGLLQNISLKNAGVEKII